MKKVLKILGILAIIIGLGLGLVMYLTAGMTEAGEKFFAAAKNGDTSTAYSYLAQEFRAGTTAEELDAFLETLLVRELESIEWGARSISGGQGNVSLSLQLAGGGVLPLSLDMIKESGDWKIYAIWKTASGIQDSAQSAAMPDEAELVRLVRETNLVFAESVHEKSMQRFYDHFSVMWQQQIEVARLDEVYGSFLQLPVDFRQLQNIAPVFDGAPRIDERGVLIVKGYYPAGEQRFSFEQSYVFEGAGWKLIGYSANFQ